MNRSVILGLLVALVVLALYFLIVVGSDDRGRVDPSANGTVDAVAGALQSLPGFGTELEAADVDARCFSGGRFSVEGFPQTCRVRVPEGVDVVRLGRVEGNCVVAVGDQPNAFDDKFPTAGWDNNRKDISLVGEGAELVIGSGPCVLLLNP